MIHAARQRYLQSTECPSSYSYYYYLYINVCVTLGVIAAYLFFKKNHRGVTNYF